MQNIPKKKILLILRTICIFFCIVISLIISSQVQAEIKEIPHIWSSGAVFTWIGQSVSANNISIALNGNTIKVTPHTINDYDGSVHVRIPLEYGMSSLITIKSGNDMLFNAKVFYAPTHEPELVPVNYELKLFHTESNEKSCIACHRVEVKESDMIPGNSTDMICFPCHNDSFTGLKFQHKAAGVDWECFKCHQAGAIETGYSKDGPVKFAVKEERNAAILCYQCHKEKELSGNIHIHGPVIRGQCNKCHNPHGSDNQNFLKSLGSDLCFTCHTDAEIMLQEANNTHFPALKGQCTACHDPHKSNLEYHLKRDSIAGLCAGCHGQTVTSHSILHQPVKSGDCIACHQPHVSDNEMLLLKSGNNLCFQCHKVRKEEFESTFVHEPVSKDCKICHDPHGSASSMQLRTKKDENGDYISEDLPIKALCLDCHRKLNPELIDQIENGKVQHEPVAKGECTVCHTAHSSNFKKQLKATISEVCFSCHKKTKELIAGSIYRHGPIRINDCTGCHLAHGSDNKNLLQAPFTEEYQSDFNINNYALCFNCHDQNMFITEDSDNITGFRNGNENLHYLHVNTKGANCITCHDIHASNQEMNIREKIPVSKNFTIALKFTKTPAGGSCMDSCHQQREYNRTNPVIHQQNTGSLE